MFKNIIYLTVFLILVLGVSGATVIDTENFEMYDLGENYTNLHSVSGNEWYCTNPPSCENPVALGLGTAGFGIDKEGTNKFLSMWSLSGLPTGYRESKLIWNHTNSSLSGAVDSYSIEYDFRLNYVNSTSFYSDFTGANGLKAYYKQQQQTLNLGISYYSMHGIGGTLGNVLVNFTRYRPYYYFDRFKPDSSACEIDVGKWYHILVHYRGNMTDYYTNQEVYIDNMLCVNSTQTNLHAGIDKISSSVFSVASIFNVSIDNIYLWNGLKEAEDIPISILTCPVANCIFYDDFNDGYIDDWDGYTDQAFITDGVLYFENGSSIDDFINNDNFLSYSSDKIYSVLEIDINDTTTPEILEDQQVILGVYTWCGNYDAIAQIYNIVALRDDTFSGSENRTVFNVYSIVNSNQKLLGSLVINNGETLIIKSNFDELNHKTGINFITQTDLDEGFNPDPIYSIDYLTACDDISVVTLERRDGTALNGFIGFDKIFYYTEDSLTDITDINESAIEGAIINRTIEDLLGDGANTLGFRTVAGKLGFWFLVMFFFVFMLYKTDTSDSTKKYAGWVMIVFMIIIGWYWKFIPTIVFLFLIFLIAVGGAMVFQKIFSGSGT